MSYGPYLDFFYEPFQRPGRSMGGLNPPQLFLFFQEGFAQVASFSRGAPWHFPMLGGSDFVSHASMPVVYISRSVFLKNFFRVQGIYELFSSFLWFLHLILCRVGVFLCRKLLKGLGVWLLNFFGILDFSLRLVLAPKPMLWTARPKAVSWSVVMVWGGLESPNIK